MRLRDAAALAAGNLKLSPLRTVLTMLGLAVGVGAVMTVMALGGAGEERVEQEIARLGVDKVWIHAQEPDHPLSGLDSEKTAVAAGANACAGAYTIGAVSRDDHLVLAQITGYDAGLEKVHHPSLAHGRLFKAAEYRQGSPVAVVDEALSELLGGEVIGRRIVVGNRRVRVVGVVHSMATQAMSGVNGMVVLPLQTFLDTWNAPVGEITLSVPVGAEATQVAEAAVAALEYDGGIFHASTLEKEIASAKAVVRIFVMVLSCVAVVCMLNGAIGVMNILLVSVRERQREIGLIKAIGGTSGQVAVLFLLESAAYALLGGCMGLLLGCGMTWLCSRWIGLDALTNVATMLPVLFGAAALGLLFGVLPAIRAARLQPVAALRQP